MPTTRIFKMRRPSAVPTSRLPALRESATALLRALSSGNPTPHDIARAISLDPVLVFELLLTAPLGGNDAEKLLDAIWDGRGTLIGSMVPPTDPWYEDLTSINSYDPANAKKLLADAGHNLSDVAGLVLAWGAALAGRLQPTLTRSYGWLRASILAALGNGLLLLLAMGALAVEAVQRLQAPEPVAGGTVIVVAAIGVVINGVTAALFMAGSKEDLNVRGAFLHMASDALVSLGVVAAGLAYLQFGWVWLDPVVSLVIAVVIVLGTWGLFRQSLHLAFDVRRVDGLAGVNGSIPASTHSRVIAKVVVDDVLYGFFLVIG